MIADALDRHGHAILEATVRLARQVALGPKRDPRLRRDTEGVDVLAQLDRGLELAEENIFGLVVKLDVTLDPAELFEGVLELQRRFDGADPGNAEVGRWYALQSAGTVGQDPIAMDQGSSANVNALFVERHL